MTIPELPLTGSCLCGAINVRLTKPPLLTLACHCRDCQKLSASDYSLTTMFPRDGFSITGDVITGGLGTGIRRHYYCKSCLTFVYSQVGEENPRVNLRTSILDAAASLEPFVELMTDDKLPWAQVSAPRSYAKFPASVEELTALIEAYAETMK